MLQMGESYGKQTISQKAIIYKKRGGGLARLQKTQNKIRLSECGFFPLFSKNSEVRLYLILGVTYSYYA